MGLIFRFHLSQSFSFHIWGLIISSISFTINLSSFSCPAQLLEIRLPNLQIRLSYCTNLQIRISYVLQFLLMMILWNRQEVGIKSMTHHYCSLQNIIMEFQETNPHNSDQVDGARDKIETKLWNILSSIDDIHGLCTTYGLINNLKHTLLNLW